MCLEWSLMRIWNGSCHVDYIIAKASKKLYALGLLKIAGVQDMLKVFRSSVISVLEYAVQVWQDIPDYLSDRIETVQKRALKIINPNSSYSQPLSLANETTLSNGGELLCHKFMAETRDTRDDPLSCLVSTAVKRTNPYNLRPSSRPFNNFMRTDRSDIFFTFKYSSFTYLTI